MSTGVMTRDYALRRRGDSRRDSRLSRARGAVAPALVALVLSGCALLRGREPEREAALTLPVSRSEAVRRVHAAFRDQGYRIRETPTSGTNPETEEFRQGDLDAVFRATISGSGNTTRVVFTGTFRRRRLGGLMRGDEQPVQATDENDDPDERALWARLTNLRLMLRPERR